MLANRQNPTKTRFLPFSSARMAVLGWDMASTVYQMTSIDQIYIFWNFGVRTTKNNKNCFFGCLYMSPQRALRCQIFKKVVPQWYLFASLMVWHHLYYNFEVLRQTVTWAFKNKLPISQKTSWLIDFESKFKVFKAYFSQGFRSNKIVTFTRRLLTGNISLHLLRIFSTFDKKWRISSRDVIKKGIQSITELEFTNLLLECTLPLTKSTNGMIPNRGCNQ